VLRRVLVCLPRGAGPIAAPAAGKLPPPATRGVQEVVVFVHDIDAVFSALQQKGFQGYAVHAHEPGAQQHADDRGLRRGSPR
jgi:hypothetical protein